METHPPEEPSASLQPTAEADQAAHRPYLLRALLAGIMTGVPVAWILAYLAFMPYFLGLFFFLLLGLLVGAIMYRAARAGAPIPRQRTTPVSLAVSLLISVGVLVMEYRWLPDLAVQQAIAASRLSGTSREEREAYRLQVRRIAREQIDACWPGGIAGYVRWAATSGRMTLPRAGADRAFTFENKQLPLKWIVRVAASLALMIFAIDSQMGSLAPRKYDEESEQTSPESDGN